MGDALGLCLLTLAVVVLPGEGRLNNTPLVAGEGWEEQDVVAVGADAGTLPEVPGPDVYARSRPRLIVLPQLPCDPPYL